MVVHQDYGEQFKIESFEKIMPEDKYSLEKYLASGTIKGIGPATAKKIIDKFGDETISIFKFEPMRLAEVKGISKDKAYEMGVLDHFDPFITLSFMALTVIPELRVTPRGLYRVSDKGSGFIK